MQTIDQHIVRRLSWMHVDTRMMIKYESDSAYTVLAPDLLPHVHKRRIRKHHICSRVCVAHTRLFLNERQGTSGYWAFFLSGVLYYGIIMIGQQSILLHRNTSRGCFPNQTEFCFPIKLWHEGIDRSATLQFSKQTQDKTTIDKTSALGLVLGMKYEYHFQQSFSHVFFVKSIPYTRKHITL